MALPIVYKSPKNPNVDAAKAKLKAEAEEKAARRERYLNATVPNYICYAWLFPNFDPKTGKDCPASSILSGQRQLDFPMLFERYQQ
jgi:hypothetical protein